MGRKHGIDSTFVLPFRNIRRAHLARLFAGSAIFATMVGLASPANAVEWSVTTVRGTVLTLAGDAWFEVERGPLATPHSALRTLQSGRLEIEGGATKISVGRNTVVELLSGPDGVPVLLRQHSGQVTLRVEAASSQPVSLEAHDVVIVARLGTVSVALAGERVEIAVSPGGVAMVTDQVTGRVVTLTDGQSASARQGAGVIEVGGSVPGKVPAVAAGAAAGGLPPASGAGAGGNAGNGNNAGGNAGNNGVGPGGQGNAGNGGNGAAGGANANENAAGNAGGGGNGEGGVNANENAGGNAGRGNSNAGGNGGANNVADPIEGEGG